MTNDGASYQQDGVRAAGAGLVYLLRVNHELLVENRQVEARVLEVCAALGREGAVRRRGEFLWDESDAVAPRSRAGTRIPAERIAPEEYAAAVRAVLAGGHALPRPQLAAEARALLGFARTGPVLDEAIGRAVDALLAAGALGEASGGVRLRGATAPRAR